jgi:hypothetical protein
MVNGMDYGQICNRVVEGTSSVGIDGNVGERKRVWKEHFHLEGGYASPLQILI